MKKFALFLALAFIGVGGASASDKSSNGIYRPTLSTHATAYLKKFPLNKVAVDEVIQYVGTPDKSLSITGSEYLTYDIEPKHGNGVIEYTYIVKDGVVVNVTYLNSGNFFGVTQRESAVKLQTP
ncbi:hypothetical protein [Rhodanobacter sp. L36]|uniref:hypothetical protein n=1 Tax=Rhodanobacter sp. L36 TaxID=1747221 RepID=UPI00131DF277|nr:hypothetical protein [Rhodanobacter sp. L36]